MKQSKKNILIICGIGVLAAVGYIAFAMYDEYTPLSYAKDYPQLAHNSEQFKITSLRENILLPQSLKPQPCPKEYDQFLPQVATYSDASVYKCSEYHLNTDESIFELMANNVNRKALFHKQKDVVSKLIEPIYDYPGWSYIIDSVTTDGKIYFRYGGWRYTRSDGYKLFVIEKK
jgi:hypothetical protein